MPYSTLVWDSFARCSHVIFYKASLVSVQAQVLLLYGSKHWCHSFAGSDILRTSFAFDINLQARAKLVKQVQRLSRALKAADKGGPAGAGRVSRKTFANALAREGGLGTVGEAELTR